MRLAPNIFLPMESDEDVFGETPNTACETHALPGSFRRLRKSTDP
jgi:hypothetical protein